MSGSKRNDEDNQPRASVAAAWGNGDPYADAVQAAASGQEPLEILDRRPRETDVEYADRVKRWANTGLNDVW